MGGDWFERRLVLRHLPSVELWQVHIEQDQVRQLALCQSHSGPPVRSLDEFQLVLPLRLMRTSSRIGASSSMCRTRVTISSGRFPRGSSRNVVLQVDAWILEIDRG